MKKFTILILLLASLALLCGCDVPNKGESSQAPGRTSDHDVSSTATSSSANTDETDSYITWEDVWKKALGQ